MNRDKTKDGTTRLTGQGPLASWPVGSVYISIAATSPANLFGGTWQRFANGRVLVGLDETDTDFDTPMETSGSKTTTLTTAQIPSHSHSMAHSHPGSTADSAGAHTHGIARRTTAASSGFGVALGGPTAAADGATMTDGAHQHTLTITPVSGDTGTAGQGGAHSNLQPSIAVYMWRRTA